MPKIFIKNIATNADIVIIGNEQHININGYKVDFILNGLLECSIQIETTKEMEIKEIKEYIEKAIQANKENNNG